MVYSLHKLFRLGFAVAGKINFGNDIFCRRLLSIPHKSKPFLSFFVNKILPFFVTRVIFLNGCLIFFNFILCGNRLSSLKNQFNNFLNFLCKTGINLALEKFDSGFLRSNSSESDSQKILNSPEYFRVRDRKQIMKLKIEITPQNLFRLPQSPKKDSPEEATIMLDAGIRSAKGGNHGEARQSLSRVTEIEPENETAWLWLASISEYPEELLAFLRHVLRINPRNERALEWSAATQSLLAENFIRHGIEARREDRPEFARRCFLQAAAHNPQNENAFLELSSLAGSPEEKTSYLEELLKINPAHEIALSTLDSIRRENLQMLLKKANFAAISGERETALRLLAEVMQSTPETEEIWLLKAYLALESEGKAVCYEKVLQLNPDNEAAQAGLASLRAIIQKADEQKSFAEALKDAFEAGDLSDLSNNDSNSTKFCINDYAVSAYAEEPTSEINDYSTAENFELDINSPAELPVPEEKISDDTKTFAAENEVAEVSATQTKNTFGNSFKQPAANFDCPFCRAANEPQAIICGSCRTILSLADLDMVLAYRDANSDVLQAAIEEMESARKSRKFNADELISLAIANLNAKNLRTGLTCLQEAAQLMPNDIGLISKINFLTIRLAEIEAQNQKTASNQTGKCTIMIVDDNPLVRKLVAGKLEKCGHTAVSAIDGKDALSKISEITPDLILLDIAMPEMDGYRVCEIIRSREETKNTPVLMISDKDAFFDAGRGQTAGSTGFIVKPFGPETLMRTIENYLS